LTSDISSVYSPEYLDIAATVHSKDPQTFERLKKNLKDHHVSVSAWVERVKEIVRKRVAETKAAIKVAAATNAKATVAPIAPPAPDPWDHPVSGLTLLNDLRDFLAKFVVLTQDELIAISLWIIFTYFLDLAEYSPRLAITSPTKRCGKTVLLDLLGKLMLKAIVASNVSAAAIFRIIEQEKCGLLIDEYDTVRAGSETFEEVRGIANSGHTRSSAFVLRAVKSGDDFVVKRFSTWAPMAVAAIGRLPDTWADRAIAVAMKRKPPEQKVERLIRRNTWAHQTAADLARKIQRWANDYRKVLEVTEPKLPDGLDDRSSNNWELLLAIAEVVGGDWPQQARQAAVQLSSGRDDAGSLGEILIADIRKVFAARLKLDSQFDRITSAELCAALADLEARPWAEFGRSQKAITAPQLARQLKHFGISPDSIRVDNKNTPKGYMKKQFDEVFSSYPLENSLSNRNNSTTLGAVGGSDDFQNATLTKCYGSKNGTKSNGEKGCCSVADQNVEISEAQQKKETEGNKERDARAIKEADEEGREI
jgi:putative DNA primase/helicase